MSPWRRAALTLAVLLAIGGLWPPLTGAVDVWPEIVRLAARARELQTPERAFLVWGAPRRRSGDLRPLLAYDPQRPPIDTVELKYRLKDANPRRLEFVDITLWSPDIREETLRTWFGPPAGVEKNPERLGQDGALWTYGGKDRADLGVIQVVLDTATAERARSLSKASAQGITPTIVIRLDGAPRPAARPPAPR